MNEPVGVVLAGGLGRRIGGAKAIVELSGVPLIRYPMAAMQLAVAEVAVLAKADTKLPRLPDVTVWIEAERARHPLVGLIEALALAAGRPVMVCAADLPFVTPELIESIIAAEPGDCLAVVAATDGAMQPLLGCYQPAAHEPLARARERGDPPLRSTVAALPARLYEVADPDLLFNVNAPEDLLRAAAMLDARRRPRG